MSLESDMPLIFGFMFVMHEDLSVCSAPLE